MENTSKEMFYKYIQKTFGQHFDAIPMKDCIFYYFKVCKNNKTYDYEKTLEERPGRCFKEFLVRSSYNVKYTKPLSYLKNQTFVIDDFYPVRLYLEETDDKLKYHISEKVCSGDIYVMYFKMFYIHNLLCDIVINK